MRVRDTRARSNHLQETHELEGLINGDMKRFVHWTVGAHVQKSAYLLLSTRVWRSVMKLATILVHKRPILEKKKNQSFRENTDGVSDTFLK